MDFLKRAVNGITRKARDFMHFHMLVVLFVQKVSGHLPCAAALVSL